MYRSACLNFTKPILLYFLKKYLAVDANAATKRGHFINLCALKTAFDCCKYGFSGALKDNYCTSMGRKLP